MNLRDGLLLVSLLFLGSTCSDSDREPGSRPSPLRVKEGDPAPVVLIVVDTLRADHLGSYGAERETSPGIDAWGEQAMVFDTALATSPWTLPSFASIYTGQLPSRHGAGAIVQAERESLFTAISPGLPTLAEMLRDHGWATGAVVNNPFLAPEFGLERGFDTYDHVPGSNASTRRADEVVHIALEWIDAREDSRFFLVVHVFDIHMTYDPPPQTRGRFTRGIETRLRLPINQVRQLRKGAAMLGEGDKEFVAAAYDEEVAFVDIQLQRFLQGLKERGVLDHGMVFLTSDHGEELFEHGGFEHGHAMWQEVLHVPMMVWGKGVRSGRESVPVSLVDVTPTVLEFLDVPIPDGLEGRSLMPSCRGESAPDARRLYAEYALYGPDRKVVFDGPNKVVIDPHQGRLRLTTLDTDPGETSPRTEQLGAATEQLAADTLEKLARLAGQIDQNPAEISLATLEKLRKLGYQD